MSRVLHLVQSPEELPETAFNFRSDATDSALLACRASVNSHPQFDHAVCLIASSAGEFRADCLGLEHTDRITARLGMPRLARSALRSLLASQLAPDLVQCWTPSLVPLARASVPGSVRVLGPVCDLPFPEPDLSARHELRAVLEVDDATPVIGVISDPPQMADSHRLQYASGLFEICGIHAVAVIPGGAGSGARGRRFHRETLLRSRTMRTKYPAWTCLPACDAVFVHTARNSPMSPGNAARNDALERGLVLMAHAAAVPAIVTREWPWTPSDPGRISASLADLVTLDLVAPSPRPTDLSHSMLRLLEKGLPEVRKIGAELKSRAHASRQRENRLATVLDSWSAATLVEDA